jgi:hypothetical protein
MIYKYKRQYKIYNTKKQKTFYAYTSYTNCYARQSVRIELSSDGFDYLNVVINIPKFEQNWLLYRGLTEK